MKHRKKQSKLGRTSSHKKAMLSNMAVSLIMHKRITTTLPKAKALRPYVEPLITKARKDTTHSRRLVFSELQSKAAVSELFREITGKVGDRPGGYTRILKTGTRLGDNASMCILELVDYNENMTNNVKAKKKRKRYKMANKPETVSVPAEGGDEEPDTNEISSSDFEIDSIEEPDTSTINTIQSTHQLIQLKNEGNMMEKDFSTLTKTPFRCEISVQINHEEGKKLKLNKEYSIDVELQIIDELNRQFITNEVMLCINAEKSTLKGSPNIRLQFDENKKSVSRYYFVPNELGEETLEFDFLQNLEPMESLPCKLQIV